MNDRRWGRKGDGGTVRRGSRGRKEENGWGRKRIQCGLWGREEQEKGTGGWSQEEGRR